MTRRVVNVDIDPGHTEQFEKSGSQTIFPRHLEELVDSKANRRSGVTKFLFLSSLLCVASSLYTPAKEDFSNAKPELSEYQSFNPKEALEKFISKVKYSEEYESLASKSSEADESTGDETEERRRREKSKFLKSIVNSDDDDDEDEDDDDDSKDSSGSDESDSNSFDDTDYNISGYDRKLFLINKNSASPSGRAPRVLTRNSIVEEEPESDNAQLDKLEYVKGQFLLKAAIFKHFREVDVIVDVLLTDSHGYVEEVIYEESLHNKDAKSSEISELKEKLHEIYETLKSEVIQIIRSAKTTIKSELRKFKNRKHKIIRVILNIIAKIKEEIHEKIKEFKKKIADALEEFRSKFKIPKIHHPTTDAPLDPITESSGYTKEPDTKYTTPVPSYPSTSTPGQKIDDSTKEDDYYPTVTSGTIEVTVAEENQPTDADVEVVPVTVSVENYPTAPDVEVVPVTVSVENEPTDVDVEVVPVTVSVENYPTAPDAEVVPVTVSVENEPTDVDVEVVPVTVSIDNEPTDVDVEVVPVTVSVENDPTFPDVEVVPVTVSVDNEPTDADVEVVPVTVSVENIPIDADIEVIPVTAAAEDEQTIGIIDKIPAETRNLISNILNKNAEQLNSNVETKNLWVGVPEECLPLFLAPNGSVLNAVADEHVKISNSENYKYCKTLAELIIKSHNANKK